ncbi:hypothetical protein KQI86_11645 [Clostridium sp. MSJ-11]|uniref:Glyoxalase-like domain-containing protein n=1 Tax=Clostridium mobile TaxID=2841512 RepID=A0ABS6EKQ5_9CLOT|nr:hypothetical protein [Clostridium mobile]MBU5484989.1 hypothetical protein [Clostridium mobile]
MFKLDHFVINIDVAYQSNSKIIEQIINSGFPYEPKWGKGTKGFKASNLWIGNEYFEMINILKPDGGGWKEDWVKLYNQGHREMICLMLDTDNINRVYDLLKKRNIEITTPEFLKFKWFFNIFTRTMPWENSYINFFQGIPLQIGIQQMKDQKSREFMNQYMVPNSRDNKIVGISKVVVKGPFTIEDIKLINDIFYESIIDKNPITIKLDKGQTLMFEENDKYHVDVFTQCNNETFYSKNITIENVTLYNGIL